MSGHIPTIPRDWRKLPRARLLDIDPSSSFLMDIDVRSAIINLHEVTKPISPHHRYWQKGDGIFSCKIAPDMIEMVMPAKKISLQIPISQIKKIQCHVRKNLLINKKSNFIIFFHLDPLAYTEVESSFCGCQGSLFNETVDSLNHNVLTIVPEKLTKGVLRKIQNDIKNMFYDIYEEIDMEEAFRIIKSQRRKVDASLVTTMKSSSITVNNPSNAQSQSFIAQPSMPILLPLITPPNIISSPPNSRPLATPSHVLTSPSESLSSAPLAANSQLFFGNIPPQNMNIDVTSTCITGEIKIKDEPKDGGQMEFKEQHMNINNLNLSASQFDQVLVKCENEEEETVLIKEEDIKCEIEEGLITVKDNSMTLQYEVENVNSEKDINPASEYYVDVKIGQDEDIHSQPTILSHDKQPKIEPSEATKQIVAMDNGNIQKEKAKEFFVCESIRIGSYIYASTSTIKASCNIIDHTIEINLPNAANSGIVRLSGIPCNQVVKVLGFFGRWQVLFIFLNDEACKNVDKQLSQKGSLWPESIPVNERHITIMPDKKSWKSSRTKPQTRVTRLGQLFWGKLIKIGLHRATTMMDRNWELSRNSSTSRKELRKIMPLTSNTTKASKVTLVTYPKPACTYRCLAALAILSSASGCMHVTDICNFISTHFPYFESDRKTRNFKNVIQPTLYNHGCFTNILAQRDSSTFGQLPLHLWGINLENPWKISDVSNAAGLKRPHSMSSHFVSMLIQGIKKGMPNPHFLDQWLTKSYMLTSSLSLTSSNVLIGSSASSVIIASSSSGNPKVLNGSSASNLIITTSPSSNPKVVLNKSCSKTLNKVQRKGAKYDRNKSRTYQRSKAIPSTDQCAGIDEKYVAKMPTYKPADKDDIGASCDKYVKENGDTIESGPMAGVITLDVFSIRFGCHEVSTSQSVKFGGQPCQCVITPSSVTLGVPTQGDIGHPDTALNSVDVPISGIRRVDAYVGKNRQLLFLHLEQSTGDFVKDALGNVSREALELISIIPVKGRKSSKKSLGKWFSQFKPLFGDLLQEIDLQKATDMLKVSNDYKKPKLEWDAKFGVFT